MNRSMLTISVMGFLCVAMLVVAMLASLTLYGGSPAADRTRLALAIQNEFKFTAVGTAVFDQPGLTFLQVRYESTGPLPPLEAQQKEMEAVAAFAVRTYDGEQRKLCKELRVQRRHISGRGCFTNTYDNAWTLKDPAWPMMTPRAIPGPAPR